MYTQTHTTINGNALLAPTANITVNRNRLKAYPGEKFYLKNNANFEIELYNPKTSSVLAKIMLNGKYISSSGIILKPGQRVYLERWIDDAKKFLFETYEVENTDSAKQAIANNGSISVEFYDETVVNNNIVWINHYQYPTYTYVNPPIICGGTSTYNVNSGNSTLTSGLCNASNTLGGIGSASAKFAAALNEHSSLSASLDSNLVETGRAEQGASSEQQLISSSGNFNYYTCNTIRMQILPESQKPAEVKVRLYCTDCGSKTKETWKHCPHCGIKL